MAETDTQPFAQNEARSLLLIDDEPAQAKLITAIAARDGWHTIVAPDAETAIALLGTREHPAFRDPARPVGTGR